MTTALLCALAVYMVYARHRADQSLPCQRANMDEFTITPLFYTFEWVDACMDPEGMDRGPDPLKIISCNMFLRNTGTGPLEKQLDPRPPSRSKWTLGSNCFSRRFLITTICKTEVLGPHPDGIFWIRAWQRTF